MAHVSASGNRVAEIERVTRGQSSVGDITNNLHVWLTERRKRLTSSNISAVARRRTTTKVALFVKSLLYSTFRGTAATAYGQDQESATREAYLSAKRVSSPGISTEPSGLVIHPQHHWLAASPDDLVNDPSSPDPLGILEYKNPYKYRSMTLAQAATQSKEFCLVCTNGSLQLKRTHMYYYQVQAAMYCTMRTWCDFVVRTSTDLHIERLRWDSAFWSAIMPWLQEFYFTAILPELALPNLHKGGIREPSSWLSDADTWKKKTEDL